MIQEGMSKGSKTFTINSKMTGTRPAPINGRIETGFARLVIFRGGRVAERNRQVKYKLNRKPSGMGVTPF